MEFSSLPSDSPLEIAIEDENGQLTPTIQSAMRAAAPGVFIYDESNQGVVLVASSNEIAMARTDGVASRPARRGEYLAIYANGLGEVLAAMPEGTPAPLDRAIASRHRISVVVGDLEVDPSLAGLAPGTTGVFQINAQLPQGVPAGSAVPLYIRVILMDGTVLESNTVTLAVDGEVSHD